MTIAVLPESTSVYAEYVAGAGGEVAELSADTDALVWLDPRGAQQLADILEAHPWVRWVQLPFAGVEPFVPLFSRFPIVWTSAKAAYSEPVAEHALTLALALMRVLPQRVVATSWGEAEGTSLYDRNVVIVGAGGIAQELIRLLRPFRAEVTVVRRTPDPLPGAANTVATSELVTILPGADLVVLAAALTDQTRHVINEAALDAMDEHAYLVNVGRGPLIDTDALVDALRDGTIAGAALDVTEPEPLPDGHPLWALPNALITPHTADTWEMVVPMLGARIDHNVKAFLAGTPMIGVVDTAQGY